MNKHMKGLLLIAFTMAGCAGWSRGCSGCMAENFGANWIVVQYRADGEPINCWKLEGAAIDNESQSDGVWWKDPVGQHLVHVSGWYNRAQVSGTDFKGAADALGVDLDRCKNGKYLPTKDRASSTEH